ncbi:MAG: glycoside hydrolase family 78 protein, partial [Flavisolibacter sp.]
MKTILSISFYILLFQPCIAQIKLQNLLVENLQNPTGLDIRSPRFSWQIASDKQNTT